MLSMSVTSASRAVLYVYVHVARPPLPRHTFHLHCRRMIDDRALRGGLAGLVAKGTPKTMTSPSSPVSFPNALNKAKATAEVEKAREGDAPRVQTTTACQARKTEEDEEEEEEDEVVELRTPGPFDFGDHSGAAHETREWVLSNCSMLSVYSRVCGGRRS